MRRLDMAQPCCSTFTLESCINCGWDEPTVFSQADVSKADSRSAWACRAQAFPTPRVSVLETRPKRSWRLRSTDLSMCSWKRLDRALTWFWVNPVPIKISSISFCTHPMLYLPHGSDRSKKTSQLVNLCFPLREKLDCKCFVIYVFCISFWYMILEHPEISWTGPHPCGTAAVAWKAIGGSAPSSVSLAV